MKDEEDIDTELLLTFATVVGRFESALRKAGFVEPGRKARPDWERFIRAIEGKYDPKSATELDAAVAYMLFTPTRQQVRVDTPGRQPDILQLCTLIRERASSLPRDVNLGRCSTADCEMMMASMLILEAWSHLEAKVERILDGDPKGFSRKPTT